MQSVCSLVGERPFAQLSFRPTVRTSLCALIRTNFINPYVLPSVHLLPPQSVPVFRSSCPSAPSPVRPTARSSFRQSSSSLVRQLIRPLSQSPVRLSVGPHVLPSFPHPSLIRRFFRLSVRSFVVRPSVCFRLSIRPSTCRLFVRRTRCSFTS